MFYPHFHTLLLRIHETYLTVYGSIRTNTGVCHRLFVDLLAGYIVCRDYCGAEFVYQHTRPATDSHAVKSDRAVLNIVLDPLFIFVFDMGVKGAALATILSQACSAW